MRLVVSAGDPSGDARASEVLRELKSMTELEMEGLGGDHLASIGMDLHHHLRDYSVMGFAEILSSFRKLLSLKRSMRSIVDSVRPDALLLVDYPGLNIPLGVWAHRRGIRVIYYISPQLWAWGTRRVKKIARGVDMMITLFNFEVDFYDRYGVHAEWAGHPLVESVPVPLEGSTVDGHLALLPGSREQEVSALLPDMLDALVILRADHPGLEARVASVASIPEELYSRADSMEGVSVVKTSSQALSSARAALVCSGTATLETSLYGVPFAIAYRTSPLTYGLARLLVRGVDRIGMANLVTGEDIAPELIQDQVSGDGLAVAIKSFMSEGPERERAIERLVKVRAALGEPGASSRAAEMIREFLHDSTGNR